VVTQRTADGEALGDELTVEFDGNGIACVEDLEVRFRPLQGAREWGVLEGESATGAPPVKERPNLRGSFAENGWAPWCVARLDGVRPLPETLTPCWAHSRCSLTEPPGHFAGAPFDTHAPLQALHTSPPVPGPCGSSSL
jgi:hypothetical protein